MTGPEIVTLGCRLNTFESEVMRQLGEGLADTVIVNTCAVTAEAERQARQCIRRLRRERPGVRILVTGCAAQLHPERFAEMPEVDRVLGNAEKLDAGLLRGDGEIAVSDIMRGNETEAPLIAGFEGRSRAFVQVQQGCDHRCTFCVVPFARGPNRSLEPEAIVAQARTLVENGYLEIALTGVDASSFGTDRSGLPSLGGLARLILERVPGLARLRLTSQDPAALDPEIFRLLAEEPRFMPHLHLSLQACDDLVLKRMKRRHTRSQAAEAVCRARAARPDVSLGADLIAGFPTEDEAMFANTLAFVEEFGLQFLHVFPFSAREGTPAARMPQVPKAVRKERAARLRAAGEARLARWLAGRVGETVEVLVEEEGIGRCPWYATVRLPSGLAAGRLARVRLAGTADGELIAEAA
ncbi:MAG: tRNA (N(6)-L-threonylcarbamoyladenosine(37)-C(2))-methylthiotransferase MtaB [Magnetospirillum sp. WYHS-4]